MPIFTSSSQSNYFSSYIDIKAISAPSNPNSGIGRLYHNSADGKLYFKLSNGTSVSMGGGIVTTASNVGSGSGWFKALNGTTLEFKSLVAGSNQLSITSNTNDLTVDVTEANIKLDDLGTPDDNTDLDSTTLKHGLLPKLGGGSTNFLRADGTWAAPPGAAGGEANTASNKGIAGVGVFIQKTGVDLEFKNVNAASGNIVVTDDTINKEIDIDIGTSVMTASSTHIMTNKTFNADGTGNSITNIENADIKAAAGIVYSKLTLTDSIVNADVNSAAAIAYSKLNLTASIVNADISNSAAIAYSKLNLGTSIVNADISGSAAIATSKLADSANFLLSTLDNDLGAHHFDMTAITAPVNPSANEARFFIEAIDANNDGLFCHIKKNGVFVKLLVF